jgi:phytoene dehydrogenase-like protein
MTDSNRSHNAVVVGAGPNGLAAAIALAQHGQSVLVLEGAATIGGGCRTAELTLPGFQHDICSAIHPLALASPFFKTLPLASYGLEWVYSPLELAHPFDDGSAAVLERSITRTARRLGDDGPAYARLMQPLLDDFEILAQALLGPLPFPRHPLALARFGLSGLRTAGSLARSRFHGTQARALFAGMAAHSMLALDRPATAAYGLMLGLFGHAVGWPLARGGSQQFTNALADYFRDLGGEIQTSTQVTSLASMPDARAVLLDVTPRQILAIAGDALPEHYTRQLRHFRYGSGVFKLDWALDGPVPWTAEECSQAATVHLGGTLEEIEHSEQLVAKGEHPERPFVILAQQSLFDPTRAPEGKQALWGYCHVPNGSTVDMTARIEAQIERFAPGFGERIIARSAMNTADFQRHNPNNIGGDINGGMQDIRQLFTRPAVRLDPYSTPNKRLFICSSSTPPGGGVHGMGGYHAAKSALRKTLTRS